MAALDAVDQQLDNEVLKDPDDPYSTLFEMVKLEIVDEIRRKS